MISTSWSLIPLGEFLNERQEIPDLNLIHRGEIPVVSKIGFNTGQIELRSNGKTKTKMILIQPGDLVISGINAAKGAIALHSQQGKPISATIHYSAYKVNNKKVDKQFLWWFLRSNFFREILRANIPGGIKTELKAKRFLHIKIPLPQLLEQQRIVIKINRLSDKIHEFKRLKQQAINKMNALLIAMAHRQDLKTIEKKKRGWREVSLCDVLTQVSDPIKIMPEKKYPHFGIFSFARGLFKKPDLSGDSIKATKLYRVHKGNFIYARLNAYEGAFGAVTDGFDEHYVSNEFPSFECHTDVVLPEFLLAYFKSPKVWEDIKRLVTGIGGGAGNRRIRLKESVFLSLKILLPPIDWQRKMKMTLEKLNAVKYEQEKKQANEDTLLPSILDRAFKGEL